MKKRAIIYSLTSALCIGGTAYIISDNIFDMKFITKQLGNEFEGFDQLSDFVANNANDRAESVPSLLLSREAQKIVKSSSAFPINQKKKKSDEITETEYNISEEKYIEKIIEKAFAEQRIYRITPSNIAPISDVISSATNKISRNIFASKIRDDVSDNIIISKPETLEVQAEVRTDIVKSYEISTASNVNTTSSTLIKNQSITDNQKSPNISSTHIISVTEANIRSADTAAILAAQLHVYDDRLDNILTNYEFDDSFIFYPEDEIEINAHQIEVFEAEASETEVFETEVFETEVFETEVFETEVFETEVFETEASQYENISSESNYDSAIETINQKIDTDKAAPIAYVSYALAIDASERDDAVTANSKIETPIAVSAISNDEAVSHNNKILAEKYVITNENDGNIDTDEIIQNDPAIIILPHSTDDPVSAEKNSVTDDEITESEAQLDETAQIAVPNTAVPNTTAPEEAVPQAIHNRTTLQQIPLGPHGRPDINPYERDIDLTVPISFQNRSLGDIPLFLTADDRFLLSAEVFIKLMRPVLNDPAHITLSDRLATFKRFGPDDLSDTGVSLVYDPSSLSVVVVEIAPEQRAIENLFAPPRDDLNDVTISPAEFSAYLNLRATQTYVWESGEYVPPLINFDGALRFGKIVFEGDAQLSQTQGIGEDGYEFSRNFARFVYDQPEDYRRWFLGDLDPEIRGQQAFVSIGGVGVVRQKRRFNSFRAAILQANRQLVVQRESTVRFLRNGALFRELRLQPGSYDFSALPLTAGSNDIDVQIVDNSGAVQNLSYQQYLDPIDLDPGDHEYGLYFGPTSQTFSRAPSYDGPLAFTGFYRKAFFDKPAIGIGVQASKDVQTITGQTQFILGNGGRILFDAGLSNSSEVGQGYTAGVSYEYFIDRRGLSDSFSLRGDFISDDFSTLNNIDGINTTSFSLTAQYTRQFSQKFLMTASASYLGAREELGDSYRIGVNSFYRLDRRWTMRFGVDYAQFPSATTLGNGLSVSFGLVFQPSFRRRAEARYESRDSIKEVSYNQSGINQLNNVGFGAVITDQRNNSRALGFATYSANRFDAAVSHASFGPNISDFTAVNATSFSIGTTIATADGAFGVGRRINDSFALLRPHENLDGRSVIAGQSLARNNFIGRSGNLGSALNNFLGSYTTQSIQYDVEDPPAGYDTGPGIFRVYPSYRSGYSIKIGTDAFVSVLGTLILTKDQPVSLIGGRVTLIDANDNDNLEPIPFFTNSVGRFAIANLLPGRTYLVETYNANGGINRSFEFSVPEDTEGLVNLGVVRPGDKK